MNPVSMNSGLPAISPSTLQPQQQPVKGFGEMLKDAILATNKQQLQADESAAQLQTGESVSLHDVMINMEQADISMRLLVTMRNKVIDAYQEIMRMQI